MTEESAPFNMHQQNGSIMAPSNDHQQDNVGTNESYIGSFGGTTNNSTTPGKEQYIPINWEIFDGDNSTNN
eukprot:2302579-Ditylum_brightwellii.AAC.1